LRQLYCNKKYKYLYLKRLFHFWDCYSIYSYVLPLKWSQITRIIANNLLWLPRYTCNFISLSNIRNPFVLAGFAHHLRPLWTLKITFFPLPTHSFRSMPKANTKKEGRRNAHKISSCLTRTHSHPRRPPFKQRVKESKREKAGKGAKRTFRCNSLCGRLLRRCM